MMEMDQFDIYVLTEALTRLATDPEVSQDKRDRSKHIALLINNEVLKNK